MLSCVQISTLTQDKCNCTAHFIVNGKKFDENNNLLLRVAPVCANHLPAEIDVHLNNFARFEVERITE